MKVTLVLSLPPAGCSPNVESHGHWTIRKRAREEYRTEACVQLLHTLGPKLKFCGPVIITATFYAHRSHFPDKRYRPRDRGNAQSSLKAAIDGFVDAGLVPDDSAKWVRLGEVEIYRRKEESKGGPPRVVVIIETYESVNM